MLEVLSDVKLVYFFRLQIKLIAIFSVLYND